MKKIIAKSLKLAAICCCLIFQTELLRAQALLSNGGFETLAPIEQCPSNPMGQCWSSALGLTGYSPGQDWLTTMVCTLNNCCVISEVLPAGSNCIKANVNVTGNMMHVTTTAGNGIDNININSGGASKLRATAWVYPVKGVVYMSLGPTGNPVAFTLSAGTCRWQKLKINVDNPNFDINQIIFFSYGTAGEFYVDNVSVVSSDGLTDKDAYENEDAAEFAGINSRALVASGLPKLEQNIPNPVNSATTINYYLPANIGGAYISIYSSYGVLVKSVKITPAGKGSINVKANELPSGTYQYAIVVDGKIIEHKQMVIAK